MSEDIYIRVNQPDTEFTKEEWDNPKSIPIEEQAVYDGRLFVKRLLIYQRNFKLELFIKLIKEIFLI